MLTVEQKRLIAEGMFRDHIAVSDRELTDRNGNVATIIRVKSTTLLVPRSHRVLFFGEETPMEITPTQKDHLVILLSYGMSVRDAVDGMLKRNKPDRFGVVNAGIDRLLWASSGR
jgi:hypothetical protein